MRVPNTIRFTLAEMASMMILAKPALEKVGSAIHLVLTEDQRFLPSPGMTAAAAIISVEDADGITVAVLKHRYGEAWDRREKGATASDPRKIPIIHPPHLEVLTTAAGCIEIRDRRVSEPVAWVKSEDPADPPHRSDGVSYADEPVVPRRDQPHTITPAQARFRRGVKAMSDMLKRAMEIGHLRSFGFQFSPSGPELDIVMVDGEISLAGLAKVFLDAYQPNSRPDGQAMLKHAKMEMKRRLYRAAKVGNITFLGPMRSADDEGQVAEWSDTMNVEGVIDIDSLAFACIAAIKGWE